MKVSIKNDKNDKKSLQIKTSRHISTGNSRANVLNCHKINGTMQNILMLLSASFSLCKIQLFILYFYFWRRNALFCEIHKNKR